MRLLLTMFIFALAFSTAKSGIETEEVEYSSDGTPLKGFIAYDASVEGKRPGVLVVHEWYGHNEYARKRAEMLAELGYVAMALDMYGEGKVARHREDAASFSGEVMSNLPVMEKRFRAAMEILRKNPLVDKEQIAAIGYCFGGGVVLHMARFGVDLDGVVSFHGSLATKSPAEQGKMKARILVCHGGDDSFIPPEVIEEFKAEMDEAGADYKFISYEGAVHSFTNPAATELGEKYGINIAYNEKADKESWKEMEAFFEKIFGE